LGIDQSTGRPRLLRHVQDCIDSELATVLAPFGYRRVLSRHGFVRDRHGVHSELRTAISSRPPSLGYIGILVEPLLVVSVEAWAEEARLRLASSQPGRFLSAERPGPVAMMALDWLMAEPGPHWTLSDEPGEAEIASTASSLAAAVATTAVPELERLSTPQSILDRAEGHELRLLQSAAFVVACGAMAGGRPEVARAILEKVGTARRAEMERALGL
jgi:hypothetical protein